MKGIAYHLPMAAICWYMGRDDEKLLNLPSWRKAGFWNFNLKGLVGHDWILSIPKAFLLGQVYGSSIEAALRWMYSKDETLKQAATKWAEGAWKVGAPNFAITGPLPLVENFFNFNLFRDSELESRAMEELEPAYRSTPSTTALAQTLSHATGWTGKFANSPVKIDNLIRGWFGGVGSGAADILSYGLTSIGASSIPQPSKSLPEIYPISGFFTGPYTPSDYVRKFYDASEVAESRMKTFNSFANSGEYDRQMEYYEKNKALLDWYVQDPTQPGVGVMSQIAKAKKTLSEISKEMARIRKDKDMDPKQKQQELLDYSKMRDELSEQYFKELFIEQDQKKVF